jgi:cytochrome c556
MRIRRYEVGGITYTPFVPTQAVSSGAASSSGSSDSSDKISGTVKKEIIDILKENGIPSDVESFLQSAQTLLDKSKHLTAYSPFGGDSDDYDMSDIIRIQSLANRVKFNKTQYDNATKRLTDEYA